MPTFLTCENQRTYFYFLPSKTLTICMAALLRKSGQLTVQGTGKADWQEVFSDGTDPQAQAGTREEVGNKKTLWTALNI